jgi:hypothetical protein
VNKGKEKGRGRQKPRPSSTAFDPSVYWPDGLQAENPWCVPGLCPPAPSPPTWANGTIWCLANSELPGSAIAGSVLGKHGPPWWAKADAAIMTNISAEANATAKALFTLLNPNLLWSLPYDGTYVS